MGETFYSALEVSPDADAAAIRSAYRERAKDHHPDVSAAPDAEETFKRLTVARDVLVDETRRARYDRLGHRAYVRRHLDSPVWPVEEGDTDHRRSSASSGGDDRSGGTATVDGRTRADPGRSTAGGGSAGEASRGRTDTATYSPTGREPGVGSTGGGDRAGGVVAVLRRVGPWIGFHILFLASTFVTVALFVAYAISRPTTSILAIFLSALLLGAAVSLSAFHVLSRLHR